MRAPATLAPNSSRLVYVETSAPFRLDAAQAGRADPGDLPRPQRHSIGSGRLRRERSPRRRPEGPPVPFDGPVVEAVRRTAARMHGNDERMPVRSLEQGLKFLYGVTLDLSEAH